MPFWKYPISSPSITLIDPVVRKDRESFFRHWYRALYPIRGFTSVRSNRVCMDSFDSSCVWSEHFKRVLCQRKRRTSYRAVRKYVQFFSRVFQSVETQSHICHHLSADHFTSKCLSPIRYISGVTSGCCHCRFWKLWLVFDRSQWVCVRKVCGRSSDICFP
jgi:hypothetical protein